MAKILLVDDEKDVVTLIKFVLVKDGHEVEAAYNGAEALKALGIDAAPAAAGLPQLIIMDVLMPVLDGLATCKRLLGHPEAGKIPVLLLTAKGATPDMLQGLTNIVGHIDKPFDPKQLREKVASMLSRQS
ncbi:MAG: response regulator [Elusimicrobia bacterium]|nr:response regulator [Elusimicrobiota bacterium]